MMKLHVIAAVVHAILAFSCLLPFTRGKLEEVDRYKMKIEEKGTRFSEEIDIDEKQDVEVFRVPAHNNVDGADYYHDFKMRLTVTRILSQKVCYVSKMDSSLPSPKKLKGDLDRAASQPGKLPVITKSHVLKVNEPANRLLLTEEILDFCGALPIYHTEVYNDTSNEVSRVERMKRQVAPTVIVKSFQRSCKTMTSNDPDPFKDVKKCIEQNIPFDITCKMKAGTCFYFVTCDYRPSLDWICREVHSYSAVPACCDYTCRLSG